MVIYDHCWWHTQLPLDKFTQKCSQYKKKVLVGPRKSCSILLKIARNTKKVLVGPGKSCSILLKIARNTKKSIGGPRQILLNFAQNCSKVTQNCSKVTQNCSKVTQNCSKSNSKLLKIFWILNKVLGLLANPAQFCSKSQKNAKKWKNVQTCVVACLSFGYVWAVVVCGLLWTSSFFHFSSLKVTKSKKKEFMLSSLCCCGLPSMWLCLPAGNFFTVISVSKPTQICSKVQKSKKYHNKMTK